MWNYIYRLWECMLCSLRTYACIHAWIPISNCSSNNAAHITNWTKAEPCVCLHLSLSVLPEKCREHMIRSEVGSDGMKKMSVVVGSGSGGGGGGGDEDQTNDVSLIRSTLGKETLSKREQYDSHLALGVNTAAAAPSSSTQLAIIASAFVVCLFIFRTIDTDLSFCSAFSSLFVPRTRQDIRNAVRFDADIRCRERSSHAMQSGVG